MSYIDIDIHVLDIHVLDVVYIDIDIHVLDIHVLDIHAYAVCRYTYIEIVSKSECIRYTSIYNIYIYNM